MSPGPGREAMARGWSHYRSREEEDDDDDNDDDDDDDELVYMQYFLALPGLFLHYPLASFRSCTPSFFGRGGQG